MRLFVIVVILLLALMGGLGIGYLIQIDTGYVRVSWSHWLLETNLWIASLLLILLYVGLNLFFKTIGTTLAVKAGFMHWREKGNDRRARLRTNRGLLELAEGNWRRAERHLTRSATQSATPLVNYLAAAQAASEQGKFAQSDQLLDEADEKIDGSALAVGLTRAQMQLARGQAEECLANLDKLRAHKPHHPMVLKLTKQALVQLEKWHELSELLPELRKSKALDDTELNVLQHQVWSNALVQVSRKANTDHPDKVNTGLLNEVWQRMPSSLRKSADMVLIYAKELVNTGASNEAANTVEKHLRHDWNEQLVLYYGRINGDTAAQLTAAEKWLKMRQQDSALLLTLGRLAMRRQQWTKAREYLEQSLGLTESPETCAELGRLLVYLETPTDASRYLLRALSGTTNLPELPEPASSEQTAVDTGGSDTEPNAQRADAAPASSVAKEH